MLVTIVLFARLEFEVFFSFPKLLLYGYSCFCSKCFGKSCEASVTLNWSQSGVVGLFSALFLSLNLPSFGCAPASETVVLIRALRADHHISVFGSIKQGPVGPAGPKGEFGFPGRPVSYFNTPSPELSIFYGVPV